MIYSLMGYVTTQTWEVGRGSISYGVAKFYILKIVIRSILLSRFTMEYGIWTSD